jgi:transposase
MKQSGIYLTPIQRLNLQQKLRSETAKPSYQQRISIILLADEGRSQSEICELLGCGFSTASRWINALQTGVWQSTSVGRPAVVGDKYINYLQELLESSPRDHGYFVNRWTVHSLNKHLTEKLGVAISDRHLKRLLKDLGLSTLSKPSQSELPRNGSRIHIADINHNYLADESDFINNNLLQSGMGAKIHGSEFIRSISYITAPQRHIRIFANITGIERLS